MSSQKEALGLTKPRALATGPAYLSATQTPGMTIQRGVSVP